MRKMLFQFSKTPDNMIFSLAWNVIFTDCDKILVLNVLEIKNTVFLEAKIWWKYDIYWLLKSSYRELFRNGKYGLVMSQNVDGKMIFTDYWKVLVLNFSVMANKIFYQPQIWWEDDIHLAFLSFPWHYRT